MNKQIKIYALDTGNFYSNHESRLHWHINMLKSGKRKLAKRIESIEKECERICFPIERLLELIKAVENEYKTGEYKMLGLSIKDMFKNESYRLVDMGMKEDVALYALRYDEYKNAVGTKNSAISKTKQKLLTLLSNKVETNIRSNGAHHMRELLEGTLSEKNVIAVFDSYFTRTIDAKEDEFCEDFMVVTKFYDDVIKDLIYHGFMFKGEKYVYFTSSAGQIRTKKTVFVKESVWKKHEKAIMCGLTVDDINAKGGNNPNKHLAYLALANSATDVWEEFDIDKTIVIDDFDTEVYGTYDFINDADYSVTRTSGHAPIEHTDGAGMMLPNAFNVEQRNMMVRLPWIKGLLGVFDFKKFIEKNNGSSIIKDIYGNEYDVLAEDIQVVFTKSQFKMWKYYDSWEHYKELYKRYGCAAGVTNIEEERIRDAAINYQMLQSITDIRDDEIVEIAKQSVEKITNVCSTIDDMKRTMGITPYNTHMTYFQKAVNLYPNLLNDEYAKRHIRSIKDSMVKRAKAGKLDVHGKYTFVLPDFYAACEHWFLGIEDPDGLLENGEVFCWLFRKNEKLDCLRSPHLYKEHPVRKNVACHKYGDRQHNVREWFETNAVYTSCKDLISRILQFDVDGDKLLVVSDKKLIEVAERNMHDVVPLYYNMRKAESAPLTNETIYNGLNAAFTGSNIGIYSNNISKIWNSDVFVIEEGKEPNEERKKAIKDATDIVKILCMENNYVIDYAKTLYKPERPKHVDEKITAFTKEALPHFFKYAKDKNDNQVVKKNDSFVNKLDKIVPNPRINCKKLGLEEIDYNLMMNNPLINFDVNDPLIKRYCDFDREYYFSVDAAISNDDEQQANDRFAKKMHKYKQMSDNIKFELSKFGYSDSEIADILVKYLYGIKKSKNKTVLWMCYGNYIVENLERYFKPQTKTIQCIDCGEWFKVNIKDTESCRCSECVKEHKRELARLRKQKQRMSRAQN